MITAEKNRLQRSLPTIQVQIREHIAWLEEQKAKIDTDLTQRLEQNPTNKAEEALLRSVPGVGPQLARTMIIELPELGALNLMGLATPQSAILSAVIFNALIIVVLVPLALRGVAYRPESAATILRRNLLIYGLGGIIAPFVGIRLIDLILVALRLV